MISPIKSWRRQQTVKEMLGKSGKVVTFTNINVAGSEFKQFSPYVVVMVEFDDGEKTFGQLVDFEVEELQIGLPVKSILRKVAEHSEESIVNYGLKFKPL